jgi:preprotein translocase subunit SecE
MLRDNRIYKFYEQVKQEAYKVTWPQKKELVGSTVIVVLAVFIFSIIFLVLDYSILNIVHILLDVGK